MKAGEDKIAAAIAGTGKNQNGWLVGGLAGGDRASFAVDWLKRAAVAKAGIYANDPLEAMYPLTRKDINGEALDGSKHRYALTFAKGQFPPVNAFWSVTMYDGKSQLLIENPINRYLINSPMLPTMKKNRDGSLTIYIQNKSPGKDQEANWLPAPDGPIYMVMRLYWPRRMRLRFCRRAKAHGFRRAWRRLNKFRPPGKRPGSCSGSGALACAISAASSGAASRPRWSAGAGHGQFAGGAPRR
jgi:hypothetical protein